MFSATPFVSVIISAGALDEALEQTLRAVEAQTLPSLEILICGPEDRLKVLRERALPRTLTLVAGTHEHGAAAWKAGCDHAAGGFVCCLMAGDQLATTYLEKCLFQILVSGEDTGGSAEEPQDVAPHIRILRKQVLLAAGGYDTRCPAGEQRMRLSSRLADDSVATVMVPEVLARPADHSIAKIATPLKPPSGPAWSRRSSYAKLVTGWPEPRPTILVAMPFLTLGGSETVVNLACRQLKRLGFRLLVYTTVPATREQGDTTSWFEDSADGIYHLPRFLDISHWPAFIAYLIQQHSVSVLWQVGSSFTYDLLPRLKELFPQLAVVDLLFNPVGHTANHLKYHYAIDRVVTEHSGMKTWLIERGVREDRITVIPNGVDLEAYSPRPKLDWRTGKPRPADDGRFVCAFLGRLSEEKAPDVFLAMASLLADQPEIEFLVCGSGPMEPVLRKQAAESGLERRVAFPGFVPTRDYLPCCDAVVVCSRLDGRPNIVMESLAMGVPVVASRVGGIPAMMPPGEEDLLCEPAEAAAFAAAIRLLANDPIRYRRASEAARRHAEAHFSIQEGGRAYARIFDDLRLGRDVLDRHLTPETVAANLGYGQNSKTQRSLRGALSPLAWPGHLRNALLLWKLRRAGRETKLLEQFDVDYYVSQFPKSKKWTRSPLLHYLFIGFRQGRNPSATFDTRYYLAANPDVRRRGVNPLLHFVTWGEQEGRSTSSMPAAESGFLPRDEAG